MAKLTSDYCYSDWVLENTGNDRDGNPKAKSHFVDCPSYTGGKATPGRRHCAEKEKKQVQYHIWIHNLLDSGSQNQWCSLWCRKTGHTQALV